MYCVPRCAQYYTELHATATHYIYSRPHRGTVTSMSATVATATDAGAATTAHVTHARPPPHTTPVQQKGRQHSLTRSRTVLPFLFLLNTSATSSRSLNAATTSKWYLVCSQSLVLVFFYYCGSY